MVRILIMMILVGRMVCGLTIDPPLISEEFQDGIIAKEIVITNDSFKRKRYRVDIREAKEYKKWSLKENIKIFPRIVSLEPKKSKRIRLRIVKEDLDDGEYKGYLVVKEMPIDIDDADQDEKSNVGALLEIRTEYWLSVYGLSGNLDHSIDIESQVEEGVLNVAIKSIGNAGRSVWARIKKSNSIEEIPICRIMRGSYEKFSIKLGLKEGEVIEDITYFNPIEEIKRREETK